jgi:hypothetical protein
MPKYPIDLGESLNGSELEVPSSSKEVFYPTVHLEWDTDYNLPESGEMVVKFKKTRETVTTREGEDKKFEVTLELHEILDVKSMKTDKDEEDDSSEDALDKLAEDSEKEGE